MTHPLINRLVTELCWPHLTDMDAVDAFIGRPGVHCLFVPGDPARNLETTDAAVILPELAQAFQGRFECAVVDDAIERAVREAADVYKTPLLLFYEQSRLIGAIPKVRDWSEYLARISDILEREPEGAH